MPEISIIIPCYKTEPDLLKKCMESILNQTFQDFEIIIIDDGNTEEYRSVYKKEIFLDKRIKVIMKQNEGVSKARNDGLKYAEGNYIVYIDSDDIALPGFFDEAYRTIRKYDADCVIGGNIDINLAASFKYDEKSEFAVKVYSDDNVKKLRKYMLGRKKYMINGGKASVWHGPWTRLIRKNIAEEVLFDTSLPIGEDVVWNLMLLQKCKKVCIAETAWYGYYYNPDSATRRFRNRAIEESEESLNKMKPLLDFNNDKEYYSFCSRAFTDLDRIYRCYIGNNQNPLSSAEIKKRANYVYTSKPWAELKSKRYFKMCSKKEKMTVLLYRFKLLFTYYSLRDKKNSEGKKHG